MKKIGVVGSPGGWSSEKLADAVAERTGFRLLVDPGALRLDLPSGRILFGEVELNSLDGLIIKKSASTTPRICLTGWRSSVFCPGRDCRYFPTP